MTTVVLVVHLLITVFLIGFILIQRSEGGALGMGGAAGMGGLMNARGSANFLTRTTKYLGIAFFATSIILALLSGSHGSGSFADQIQNSAPAQESPAAPDTKSEPSAPLPQ